MPGIGTFPVGDAPIGADEALGSTTELIAVAASTSGAQATLTVGGTDLDGVAASSSGAEATLTAVQPIVGSALSRSGAQGTLTLGEPSFVGQALSRSGARATLVTSAFPPGASVGFIRCA